MKTLLIFTVLAATSLLFFGSLYTEDNSGYEAYIAKYAKNYNNENEYLFRKSLFESNLAKINKINSEEHSYTLAMNVFGDWTDEEFKQILGFRSSIQHTKPANWGEKHNQRNVKSIDWTAKGVVSDVKNQGKCGSCWAFSAVGAIEGAFAIRCNEVGTLTLFSEQQLVDCENPENGWFDAGCNGGEMYNAFEYYKTNGPCFAENYPYTALDGTCHHDTCRRDAQIIDKYEVLTNNDPDEIYDNLVLGPHSLGVEADSTVFRFFKSGVIDDDSCGHDLNHGVLLTGWIASKDAWKIKNSWGTDYGENGYVYIKDNHEVSYGYCGVNMEASIPYL